MEVIRYSADLREEWDDLVRSSRNGTFLFERQFMDYHADRFEDISLLFARKGKIVGVLPCSRHGDEIVSHGGLTYGGFILSNSTYATVVEEMLDETVKFYRAQNYKSLIVKPLPSIYHVQRSEEELYWMYRKGATLTARSISSAIDLDAPLPFSTLRKRKLKKAMKAHLAVQEINSSTDNKSWAAYWEILTQVLHEKHSKKPVHSLAEILLLKERFPSQIKLWTVLNSDGQIIAGILLFITKTVIHAQYIAASLEGKANGALDVLVHHLVDHYSHPIADAHSSVTPHRPRFLDFGISTEDGGTYLNEGLIFQKEGFGARSIVYDAYTLQL